MSSAHSISGTAASQLAACNSDQAGNRPSGPSRLIPPSPISTLSSARGSRNKSKAFFVVYLCSSKYTRMSDLLAVWGIFAYIFAVSYLSSLPDPVVSVFFVPPM